ncbi:hypothetical protein CFP56_010044, partial [Quercus suber]
NFEKVRHVSILDHNLGVDVVGHFLNKLSNNLQTIIFSCKEGEHDEHDFININELLVETCISRFKYLQLLDLRFSRLVHFSEGIQHLTALHILGLTYCDSLMSLPHGMKHRIVKSLLTIGFSPKLVSLPQGLIPSTNTLHFLSIYHCGNLAALPHSLQKLDILSCPKLLSPPKRMDQNLDILNCPKSLSLPKRMNRGIF